MSPFAVDYENLEEVVTFAKSLNHPMTVVAKYPNEEGYSICPCGVRAARDGARIVWCTFGYVDQDGKVFTFQEGIRVPTEIKDAR